MIQVENLNKSYERIPGADSRVLKNVSLTLPDKGFVCILGPSGCGKTSLLNAIGGLDRFDSGNLIVGDQRISSYGTAQYESQRNRDFGYIFQNYYLLEDHSVAYNVYLGLHSLQLNHREKIERVRAALKAVEMDRYIRRRVRELSGGQQQRVAIARALARRPRVIFADEPTGNLDEANTLNVCQLLHRASKESLVIMVTHEEHIANVFADRIIRLDQGHVVADTTTWNRTELSLVSDREIYAGDMHDTQVECGDLTVRLLQTPGASPVSVTVIAAKDRIILKISDERTVKLADIQEDPRIIEGSRPVLTRESLTEEAHGRMDMLHQKPDQQCAAGKGIGWSMMLCEAHQLMNGKGLKKFGMRAFLVLMALLTLLTVADFYTVSHLDPLDFITSDSHMLIIKINQGENTTQDLTKLPSEYNSWLAYQSALYVEHIAQADTEFDFIPRFSVQPEYYFAPFFQMNNVKQMLPAFSYVALERLDPESLICGRMPTNSEEIVVDKILLDAVLEKDGIIKNGITSYESFIGENLNYGNKNFNPIIVGVSDSGERSVYISYSAMYALCAGGTAVITLSELQQRYPGQYDVLEMQISATKPLQYYTIADLQDGECVINLAQAGVVWKHQLGRDYGYAPNKKRAVAFLDNPDIAAHIVVTDAALEQMILRSFKQEIYVWCTDKAAMRVYLSEKTQMEKDGYISVEISDPYAQKYAHYEAATARQSDSRIIVTGTIIAICMLMLYLLCRSRAHEHLDLLAVYRLLGIPGKKLYIIFLIESLSTALVTLLPTLLLTWLGLSFANKIPELEVMIQMPFATAIVTGLLILLYYLLVSIFPLMRLLRYPPAHLAAKCDL